MRRAGKKILKPTKPSKVIEKKYRDNLLTITKHIQKVVRDDIIPKLYVTEVRDARTEYSVSSSLQINIQGILENTRRTINGSGIPGRLASEFVQQVDSAVSNSYSGIGVDLGAVIRTEGLQDDLRNATDWNTSLITKMTDDTLDRIGDTVLGYASNGVLPAGQDSLVDAISHIADVTDSRAKLIARDQTAKVNAALVKTRQENLGVTEFVWLTADDERVRSNHDHLNGKTFSWSTGADGIFPGQEVQCRCIALPVIST